MIRINSAIMKNFILKKFKKSSDGMNMVRNYIANNKLFIFTVYLPDISAIEYDINFDELSDEIIRNEKDANKFQEEVSYLFDGENFVIK